MPNHTHISIEDIARLPLPGMAIPGSLAFSPDGRWITYLYSPEGSLVRQLYRCDPSTGETHLLCPAPGGGASENNLSPEARLRRERTRQHELGITSYTWDSKGERLLIPLPDGLYVQEGIEAELHCILQTGEHPAIDPQFSPDGEWVAYVQQDELFILPAGGGEPRQLTFGARETGKTHGLAEFVAQEEMGRHHGFWWSPDSRRIAFSEVDETHIPLYRIVHQGQDHPGAYEDHRYPFAGQPNAVVRLGVVSIEGGDPLWMDLGGDPDIYLARVDWLPSGALTAQVENRAQTELRLFRFDVQSGNGALLLIETSPVWINLHDMFKPLQDGRFIWASERSGFRHLYLYGADGSFIRQLTQGEWLVDALKAVDETAAQVYFTASRETPLESHLYAVPLDGGEPRRITWEAGMHNVVVDPASGRFIDTHDSLRQPPHIHLRSLAADSQPANSLIANSQPANGFFSDSLLAALFEPNDPRLNSLNLQPPELVTLNSRDGELLYGALYRPPAEFGTGPYPLIVHVYGGPHAQLVANSWRVSINLRLQYLCSLGYLVFVLDNRGSARRGLAFEGAIKHNMGDLEVRDQVDGVNWLVEQGLADPARVGITGWSGGGYMSLMCLGRAPQTFKLAVSGAPVTHFDGYDTHYTERYMGTPQENPDGYRLGSVLQHVENIKGKLMLVHGLIDENVHFRHTARLINALIGARVRYELLLFPDARHGPRRLADRIYLEERVRDFFLENL